MVAPRVKKDWPVTAVYVDHALVLGYDYHDIARGLAALRGILDELLLVYHEIVEPCKGLSFVGMCLDLGARELRNTQKRTWRLH